MSARRPEQLTAREQVVYEKIALGGTNRSIAVALDISVDTVKTHVRHVYGKLGLHSRLQAALHDGSARRGRKPARPIDDFETLERPTITRPPMKRRRPNINKSPVRPIV